MQSTAIPGLVQASPDILSGSADRLQAQVRAAASKSGEKRSEELKQAAQEFESLFVGYLLKVMRETIEESGLMEEGLGKGIYTDLFDQEVSRTIAKQGALGISDLILQRMEGGFPTGAKEQQDYVPGTDSTPSSRAPDPVPVRGSAGAPEPDIPDFRLPIRAPVSSAFGPRTDPISGKMKFHRGIDLAAPAGMEVRAPREGTVEFAGYQRNYGNTVVIRHADGVQTRYAHLGNVEVKAGESVALEQVLGKVGNTGRSTGPHLHFEVIRRGERINPTAGVQ